MPRDRGASKIRVDINVSAQTKQQLDAIIDCELEDDHNHDRPERSRSEILEMIIRKGIKMLREEDEIYRKISVQAG
jgi:hypothetical protein